MTTAGITDGAVRVEFERRQKNSPLVKVVALKAFNRGPLATFTPEGDTVTVAQPAAAPGHVFFMRRMQALEAKAAGMVEFLMPHDTVLLNGRPIAIE